MARVRIFVSFDERHDKDLHELLSSQSQRATSTFQIVGSSPVVGSGFGREADPRPDIRSADEVIVICGEHTDESVRVSVELSIAQEEDKPYMLLWGRRDQMCTKPSSALAGDGMYSWTREVLESQISMTMRRAAPLVVPESCKRQDR